MCIGVMSLVVAFILGVLVGTALAVAGFLSCKLDKSFEEVTNKKNTQYKDIVKGKVTANLHLPEEWKDK
jgi:hypothetical protein